jgi:hypothetical protein
VKRECARSAAQAYGRYVYRADHRVYGRYVYRADHRATWGIAPTVE